MEGEGKVKTILGFRRQKNGDTSDDDSDYD
jgi:hypothetical protein